MVIVSNDLQYPTGLAIDYVHDKLYWADSKAARIEMADLNGDNQKVVIRFQTGKKVGFETLHGGNRYGEVCGIKSV